MLFSPPAAGEIIFALFLPFRADNCAFPRSARGISGYKFALLDYYNIIRQNFQQLFLQLLTFHKIYAIMNKKAIAYAGDVMNNKIYAAIDLKSFYASVECVERGLDPLDTNLVVADESRTEKTICLAVSPTLKTFGTGGRPRLFEVVQKVREVNRERRRRTPGKMFSGKSVFLSELNGDPFLAVDYITATPRMALYMEYSTRIYGIYLRYFSPEDVHIYSCDEVFIDVTDYLELYQMTAHELIIKIIREVLRETGITATAGIGTNLFLAKVAMDIVAKKMPADKNGVRIAELDEQGFRRQLWEHRPLTDFWHIGRGYAKTLEQNGMFTPGDVAERSVSDEDSLFKLFGVNAELLIDHAWGIETTTIADIKAYKPRNNSLSNGQVLQEPYSYEKARIIVREMADDLSLSLAEKNLVTDKLTLTIGYDAENLADPRIAAAYRGELTTDFYGRSIPKHAHGTENLERKTYSPRAIGESAVRLFDRIINPNLLVRRVTICACEVTIRTEQADKYVGEQLDLFTDYSARDAEIAAQKRDENMQLAILKIKHKFGKNAILKGMNFEEGATMRERNQQIGGHRA